MALPPELDFSTPSGKIASPERMNLLSAHIDARLRALEAARADLSAAIDAIKELGLARINSVIEPLVIQATEDATAIAQAKAATDQNAWRQQLIADVVAAIKQQGLFIQAGSGAAGMTLFSGSTLPDPAQGTEGDLYIYVEPQ